jgi:DNA polymerase elongation subunit (family B)
VLGTVEDDPEFVSFRTERDMILAFSEFLKEQNPDIICGYNTFGFDDGYMVDRCDILDITSSVMFGRTPAYQDKHLVSKTFELASGKYDLRYWNSTGRLCIDLLLNMRREHSLDSFKLDNVASVFLRGSVQKVEGRKVYTKSTRGLRSRNFVKFETVGNTTDPYTDKVVVEEVGPNYFILQDDVLRDAPGSLEWTLAKDDVDAHTLFALHRQGPAERARIARYCIQDCDLVLTLMAKLDTLVNARGMAEVCKVPMSFVLLRGQGIKIFSAVVSIASTRNQILKTLPNGNGPVEDWSYEGAIVIEPKINMYLDQPISVLDFNSLYPTNMIAYNISPDTLVSERTFNPDGKLLETKGKTSDEMRALRKAGHVLDDISYDNKKDDIVTGKTICTYAQPSQEAMSRGILPLVLDILLKKRKETRKLAETIADEGQKAVLNGLQLAYKVVANSVYGQTGSRTSPIRRLCVAASTTAAGRTQLLFAKKVVEEEFNGEVIYGDTDSIFIKFLTKDVGDSIVLGTKAAERITELCRKPYVIGYEKTFYPFILFCRKRYVGMMYEEDPNPAKAKRKSMGIVLKRRDNAPIVKEVFGGALDILLQDRDIKKAQGFVVDTLKKVLEHKIPIEKYVVSKSLRDDYKNPGQIAHRVLADRMAERDPGNKPQVGDRIPYIYVDGRGGKQGDRIDHIDYVRQNNLRPDVEFYITNQIQNPVAQLFALCIESMDGYREPRPSYKQVYETLLEKRNGNTEEATIDLQKKKEKHLETILFLNSPSLRPAILKRNGQGTLDAFLKR